ncbi:MAG: hypothetical protein ACYCXF_09045 [Thermoleophilia bacterium]
MQQTKCPYCHTNINERSPEAFSACPHCGYRFAQVNSRDSGYLIIDRRVGQTPIAGTDRRR